MNFIQKVKNLIKDVSGNSLGEFAVTVALMAILVVTAMPKLSNVGENSKVQKSKNEMDKLLRQASNFFQQTATDEGRGRFPGQDKYNTPVGRGSLDAILKDLEGDYTSFSSQSGYDWVSVFGVSNVDFPKPENAVIRWDDEDETDPCNTCPPIETIGREEWAKLFPAGPLGSPFQDGHYVYQVVPGHGHGSRAVSPILFIADIENPAQLHIVLQP